MAHTETPPAGQGQMKTFLIRFGVLLLVCLCIGAATRSCGSSDSSGDSGGQHVTEPDSNPLEAKAQCEASVKGKLKAPATADFTNESDPQQDLVTYTMYGTVDAENSFGAKLRTAWTCTTVDEQDGTWTTTSALVGG